MILRRPATPFRQDYDFTRVELERRLGSSVSLVRSVLFSPTWGRKEDFVGSLDEGRLAVRVRHGYSNGLTRIFYGTISSLPQGSRIEGEFRTLWWVVAILRVTALFFLVSVLVERQAVPLAGAMIGVLSIIEAIARRMGDRDEEKMRAFLSKGLDG